MTAEVPMQIHLKVSMNHMLCCVSISVELCVIRHSSFLIGGARDPEWGAPELIHIHFPTSPGFLFAVCVPWESMLQFVVRDFPFRSLFFSRASFVRFSVTLWSISTGGWNIENHNPAARNHTFRRLEVSVMFFSGNFSEHQFQTSVFIIVCAFLVPPGPHLATLWTLFSRSVYLTPF